MKCCDIEEMNECMISQNIPMDARLALVLDKDDCSELLIDLLNKYPDGIDKHEALSYLKAGIAYRFIHGSMFLGRRILCMSCLGVNHEREKSKVDCQEKG